MGLFDLGASAGAAALGGPIGEGAYQALAIGSKLGGALFRIRSARARAGKLHEERQKIIGDLARQSGLLDMGPTGAEASVMQGAVDQTLSGLAQRGVLNSSFAAPEVAAAVAPYQLRMDERRQGFRERLAAARLSIAGDEADTPGYGDAFAGALGDVGSLFAIKAQQRHVRDIRGSGADAGTQDAQATPQDIWDTNATNAQNDPYGMQSNMPVPDFLWKRQRRALLGY